MMQVERWLNIFYDTGEERLDVYLFETKDEAIEMAKRYESDTYIVKRLADHYVREFDV